MLIKNIKIILISPSFYPATYYGGPIFSLFNITKCLAKNDIKIFVVTTNCNGNKKLDVVANKFLESEKNLFIKYYGGGSEKGFSIRMYLALWKDIIGKDLIYLVSIFSPPTPLVLLLNIFFRKPLILSARGQLGDWCLGQGNIFKKLWLKIFITPIANKITWEATSQSEKEMVLKVYPKARVVVIPAVINVEEFQVRSEKQGVNGEKQEVRSNEKDYSIYAKLTGKKFEGKKIIVSMGRLHKVKGFDILINAVNELRNSMVTKFQPEADQPLADKVQEPVPNSVRDSKLVPNLFRDLVLLIAGEDFGERKNLEELINRLELNEKVFLVGNIEGEDKKEFLRNADVFALASHHENFGIVYAEALASGIPIVASRNTPWQDIEKLNCGKWVDNSSEEFAAAITEIIKSNTQQMGINGWELVCERFSGDVIINKYNLLFNSLLKKN